jgi:glycosyltransferase involved in cell wall biosynthesis
MIQGEEKKSLSVVFSFRNEQEVLPELIKRTRSVLLEEERKGSISSYELIFVNDASTDRSLEILRDHAEGWNDIRVINMSRRFGVSPCVLAGMEFSSGDAVVYLDADLQDPPEVIPELLEAWRKSATIDVVHTVRRSRAGESVSKRFLTWIGYKILHRVTSVRLPIEAGDFKLLSRRAVDQVIRLREKRPFLRGLICWIGFGQAYVPYHRDARQAGQTKFPVFSWRVMANFMESALVSFSAFPLQVASLAGCCAALIGFGLLVDALIEKIQGHEVPGSTVLAITMLFLGSVQLFSLGVLGVYVSNLSEESKGRPNYIVDSHFGFPQSYRPKAGLPANSAGPSTRSGQGERPFAA